MTRTDRDRLHGRARARVLVAIKSGRLVRRPCEVCGAEPTDAHHGDYAKPLEVAWLCRAHHRWLHIHGDSVTTMKAKWAARAAA